MIQKLTIQTNFWYLGLAKCSRFIETQTAWYADGTFDVVPSQFFQLYTFILRKTDTSSPVCMH